MFGGASFKLDYLTKPSFFQDFGFVEKVKMVDRVKEEDEIFVVGYPYFNVDGMPMIPVYRLYIITFILTSIFCRHAEMLVVEELYKGAVEKTARQLIIFNGELDRIRSGCILSPGS